MRLCISVLPPQRCTSAPAIMLFLDWRGNPSFTTTVQCAWEGQMVMLVSPDTGQNK